MYLVHSHSFAFRVHESCGQEHKYIFSYIRQWRFLWFILKNHLQCEHCRAQTLSPVRGDTFCPRDISIWFRDKLSFMFVDIQRIVWIGPDAVERDYSPLERYVRYSRFIHTTRRIFASIGEWSYSSGSSFTCIWIRL